MKFKEGTIIKHSTNNYIPCFIIEGYDKENNYLVKDAHNEMAIVHRMTQRYVDKNYMKVKKATQRASIAVEQPTKVEQITLF